MFRSLCLALLILAGAAPAVAGCKQSIFYNTPSVPSAQSSTYEQMVNAVSTVKQYIRNAEEMLEECYGFDSTRYNYYVSRLKSLASAMNTQSEIFKSLDQNS